MSSLAVSTLSNRIAGLGWREEHPPETLPTGIQSMDALVGGAPRGRITEIVGAASSGRTSMLHSILSEAGKRGEFCAVVDATDAFDPRTAAEAGARLDTLVWVRCGGNAEHAVKSADMLLHSGGFGVVALDLCDVTQQVARRIPLSYWYRFRRAVESTQTVLLILGREPLAMSCASVLAEVERESVDFSTATATLAAAGDAVAESPRNAPFRLMSGARFRVKARRPLRPQSASFETQAVNW